MQVGLKLAAPESVVDWISTAPRITLVAVELFRPCAEIVLVLIRLAGGCCALR
jgi:hypothetical protein